MELCLRAKVQKEPDLQSCCPEIVQELSLRCIVKFLRCLYLDDNFGINNHIHSLNGQFVTLVHDRNAYFSRHLVTCVS